jgi:hypothetical protein
MIFVTNRFELMGNLRYPAKNNVVGSQSKSSCIAKKTTILNYPSKIYLDSGSSNGMDFGSKSPWTPQKITMVKRCHKRLLRSSRKSVESIIISM